MYTLSDVSNTCGIEIFFMVEAIKSQYCEPHATKIVLATHKTARMTRNV